MELRTLQYFLTVAREENITRASEVNGSTRGKYYKSLGSAAHYAAYFKQADEAAGTGKRYLRRFVERAFNNARAPLCAKGNIQLAGR